MIERKIYAPTQINTPSLKEKNDHNFSVSISAPYGYEMHGSYALSDRVAIMGGLFSYKNEDEEKAYSIFSSNRDSALLLYKHKGFHIGTGGYFPLIKNKSSSLFISFFGTYTDGNFKMSETSSDNANPSVSKINFFNSDINRWALQSSLHFYSNHIHQSLTTRYNYVGYHNIETDYTNNEQYSYNLPPHAHSRWSSFIDFGFDTKIFFTENQKLGLQVFGSLTARLNDKDYNFYHYPFRIGAGLVVKSPFKNNK